MEAKRNSEQNEINNLVLVLEEFTEEQKSLTKTVQDLENTVGILSESINCFEKEISKPESIHFPTDTQPIQHIIDSGISDIKSIISTIQKPIQKKFQFFLFPEQDAKLFYKIVFGRWLLWLTLVLTINNLYKFSIHWRNDQKEITLQLLQNDRIKKSWEYLYFQHSKGIKKLMDSAYSKFPFE